MSLIYALFWLVLGADLRAVDILLFAYCDVITIAFWGWIFYRERKENENDSSNLDNSNS